MPPRSPVLTSDESSFHHRCALASMFKDILSASTTGKRRWTNRPDSLAAMTG